MPSWNETNADSGLLGAWPGRCGLPLPVGCRFAPARAGSGRGRRLRRCLARPLRRQHPLGDAPVLRLQLAEAREGRQQALLVRLGIVDARHQRLGDLVQAFTAQPPPHKLGQRLVAVVAARRDKEVHPHAQLAPRRDQGREDKGLELGGHDHQHAVGQRLGLALVQHIGLALPLVGAQHVRAQPQLARQRRAPRLLRDKRVRPALDDKGAPVRHRHVLGVDLAAPAVALLQQHVGYACLLQVVGRAEPGNAAADDDDWETLCFTELVITHHNLLSTPDACDRPAPGSAHAVRGRRVEGRRARGCSSCHPNSPNTARMAACVAAISSAPCAVLTKPASNWLGAK